MDHVDGDTGLRALLGADAVAGWLQLPAPTTAEIVARSGVDLVCLDGQHGLLGPDALLPLLHAVQPLPVLVRVPRNEPVPIEQALDRGAAGVIVPLVDSAAEAEAAVRACAYPPAGDRSYGPTRVGWTGGDVLTRGGCVVMIETTAAVADLAAIVAVPGIDALFVGPSDLSLSWGGGPVPPLDDPAYRELLRSVTARAVDAGLPVGVFCGDPAWAPVYRELGFTWLTLPSDARLFQRAVAGAVEAFRPGPPPAPAG